MTAKGYMDLDKVLLDFNAWEKEAAAFEKENAELKLKVKSLEKQCCLYEKAQAENQLVSTEYLAMIEKLQATLLRRCNMEVENEKLKKDLAEIEEKQKSLEKKHAQELKSALDDLEAAQEAHKMEMAILHDTLAEQSRHEVETLQQMLQNKNNENKELMKQIADSEREKQHELVKLRLEEANKMVIDGKEVIVDYEMERLLEGWVPRRLGGGFGGKKESGQLRFGGRDRPFRKPIKFDSNVLGSVQSNKR